MHDNPMIVYTEGEDPVEEMLALGLCPNGCGDMSGSYQCLSCGFVHNPPPLTDEQRRELREMEARQWRLKPDA